MQVLKKQLMAKTHAIYFVFFFVKPLQIERNPIQFSSRADIGQTKEMKNKTKNILCKIAIKLATNYGSTAIMLNLNH